MQFTALLAASAAVTGALAGSYYESPEYVTVDDKTYTSVKTCTDKTYEPTSAPVYEPAPSDYPVSEVTYTSYEKVTITSCAAYVTDCPAETYTSTAYSVSTCTGAPSDYPVPTDYPVYVPPTNETSYETTPVYEVPVYETEYPTYTSTVYETYCPSPEYCYATTSTYTYCPGKPTETPTEYPTHVPETTSTYCPETTTSTYCPPTSTAVYVPPVYTAPAPVCPGGYDCPATPSNETTYVPPPSYTGAASANTVSFGVAAIAGLAALFIAA